MQYLELTRRELEYVAITRDTTESDLRQRREIEKGTAHYIDQSAVRNCHRAYVLPQLLTVGFDCRCELPRRGESSSSKESKR
jgi:hypothetical protein